MKLHAWMAAARLAARGIAAATLLLALLAWLTPSATAAEQAKDKEQGKGKRSNRDLYLEEGGGGGACSRRSSSGSSATEQRPRGRSRRREEEEYRRR